MGATKKKPPTKIKIRIMQYARRIFAKKGFSNTTMEDIAKAANVSKGGLYHHFSSKDELFMEIIADNQDTVIKSQQTLFEKKENLAEDLNAAYDNLDFQKDLMKIWLEVMSESAHNSKFRNLVIKRRKHLEELSKLQLQQIQTNLGLLSGYTETDLARLAKGSLAMTKGCGLDSVTGDDPALVKDAWIQTMFAILASKKHAKDIL